MSMYNNVHPSVVNKKIRNNLNVHQEKIIIVTPVGEYYAAIKMIMQIYVCWHKKISIDTLHKKCREAAEQ